MNHALDPAPVAAARPPRAFRSTDDRWLGGVASGLAQHLGVDVLPVRAAFLLLSAVGGFGLEDLGEDGCADFGFAFSKRRIIVS